MEMVGFHSHKIDIVQSHLSVLIDFCTIMQIVHSTVHLLQKATHLSGIDRITNEDALFSVSFTYHDEKDPLPGQEFQRRSCESRLLVLRSSKTRTLMTDNKLYQSLLVPVQIFISMICSPSNKF